MHLLSLQGQRHVLRRRPAGLDDDAGDPGRRALRETHRGGKACGGGSGRPFETRDCFFFNPTAAAGRKENRKVCAPALGDRRVPDAGKGHYWRSPWGGRCRRRRFKSFVERGDDNSKEHGCGEDDQRETNVTGGKGSDREEGGREGTRGSEERGAVWDVKLERVGGGTDPVDERRRREVGGEDDLFWGHALIVKTTE